MAGDDTIFVATADAEGQTSSSDASKSSSKKGKAMADPIVLAFSGGLDTSFCIPLLAETTGRPVVTVTVDTGGLDAEAATALDERARAPRCRGPRADRRPRRLLRAGATLPGDGQRAARAGLSALRRRRAGDPGAGGGEGGRPLRHALGRPRLHRGRQRPGALRGRAAHARSRARGDRAGARQPPAARRAGGVSRGARPAGAAVRRRLLDQPRPLGGDDRWPRDAGYRGVDPRNGLGADARSLRGSPPAGEPHDRLRGGRAGVVRRRGAGSGRADRGGGSGRRRRSASAAASTWGRRSWGSRGAWRSRRRPRRC